MPGSGLQDETSRISNIWTGRYRTADLMWDVILIMIVILELLKSRI
jgi:hypothetical protein